MLVIWRPMLGPEGFVANGSLVRDEDGVNGAACFSRQTCGILVHALAEASAHAGSQAHAGFAELVAQAVGGGHRVFPALLAIAFEQIDLIGLRGERGGVHAQQAHRDALFPVLAEQRAHLLEDFGIELRRRREGMGAGDGGEIGVAQLELNGARVKLCSRRRRPTISRKPRQRGFELAARRRCPRCRCARG